MPDLDKIQKELNQFLANHKSGPKKDNGLSGSMLSAAHIANPKNGWLRFIDLFLDTGIKDGHFQSDEKVKMLNIIYRFLTALHSIGALRADKIQWRDEL